GLTESLPPHLTAPHAHPPHPALHSFPTRRSSDLLAGLRSDEIRRLRVGCARANTSAAPTQPTRSGWSAGSTSPGPGRPARSATPDRKSTRLNSSHEWISYAVFCLKKKNPITTTSI